MFKRILVSLAVSVISVAGGTGIAPELGVGQALASYTVPTWQPIYNHAYCFYNYDNELAIPDAPTSSNADNPITTVFTNAATAGQTWSLFGETGAFPHTGSTYNSPDYEFITPAGQGRFPDESYGAKTLSCGQGSSGWDTHVRLYPDGSLGQGDLYDPYWGYFTLADTHEDYECNPKDFGYAEQAEGYVRQVMSQNNVKCSATGYLGKGQPCVQSIQNDAWNFSNAEQFPGPTWVGCGSQNGYRPYLNGTSTIDSSHCLENDGYATVITVSTWSPT